MLKRAPSLGKVPLLDKRDSEILAAEAEGRGEIVRKRQRADRKFVKYMKMQRRQISRNLDDVRLPHDGETLFFVSQKDINTFSLLLWIIEEAGTLSELFATTFNVNQDIIRAFAQLLDEGQCHKLSLVISQSIESRMPDRVDELRKAWDERQDKMRVSMCWNHSKVALAKTTDGQKYILTGSGNYSFNAEIEQYEMYHDDDLYDWLYQVLERRCFSESRMNTRHKVWGVDG